MLGDHCADPQTHHRQPLRQCSDETPHRAHVENGHCCGVPVTGVVSPDLSVLQAAVRDGERRGVLRAREAVVAIKSASTWAGRDPQAPARDMKRDAISAINRLLEEMP